MKRLWFKSKTYGYGWYPATWEGWLVMAAFVTAMVVSALLWFRPGFGPLSVVGFGATEVVLVIVLIVIAARTGEKARWRWGGE